MTTSHQERLYTRWFRQRWKRHERKLEATGRVMSMHDVNRSMEHEDPVIVLQKQVGIPMRDDKSGMIYYRDKAFIRGQHKIIVGERYWLTGKKLSALLLDRLAYDACDAVHLLMHRPYGSVHILPADVVVMQTRWWERLLGIYQVYLRILIFQGTYISNGQESQN